MPLNGQELVYQVIQGNDIAFKKIFSENFPKLYRFSMSFVKDGEVAREISQETFIRLWESKETLRADTNLEALLFTICRNQCLNFLKHRKVILKYQKVVFEESLELDVLASLLNDTAFQNFDFDLLSKKIQQIIEGLPDQCQTVFKLSRFNRKKYSEIAIQLKISVKTVEAHVSLALKKLRNELKDFLTFF